jgi:hypothetical protein
MAKAKKSAAKKKNEQVEKAEDHVIDIDTLKSELSKAKSALGESRGNVKRMVLISKNITILEDKIAEIEG